MKDITAKIVRGINSLAGSLMFCAATVVLPAFADAIAPDLVTNEALFWFDASTLSAAAGTELDSWADVRGGSYPGVTTYTATKPQVIEIADGPLAGKKAVTFFQWKTVCDMNFPSTQSIKTAFFVVDIDQQQYAFLLGGPSDGTAPNNYGFHRGSNGSYRYNYSITSVQYWNDGKAVAAPQTDLIPTGYQLITWSWASTAQVKNICSDRGIADRIGGKRLCEVVAFSRQLSDYERSEVEAYLKAKWFGGMSQASAMTSMFARKLGVQVHFDASVASSFHYGVDGDETGTKVSKWDDISGNNNHFITNITASTPNYGTVGTVAEKPVFDSGAAASGIDLQLNTPVNARTVFMVAEVDRSGNTFWLGDSTDYRFHRGSSGQYAYGNNSVLIRTDKGGKIWCNGNSVTDALNTYPEMPGGLCVYVFSTSSNARWGRLGLDRTGTTTRHGGKRVAELVSFSSALSDENRELFQKLLMEKWRPSDAYVDTVVAGAEVHVDASSANNFNYTDGKITGWKNTGTGADLYRPELQYIGSNTSAPAYGSYGYTNGVPAFLMGDHGSTVDLMFTRLTNIRSVFWVMDIVPDKDAFFLADSKLPSSSGSLTYHFHRQHLSPMGAYANASYGAAFVNAITCCDRVAVASVTTERPPRGTHVYDVVTKGNYTAASLSKDRDNSSRHGGRAISELLIFTTPVAGLTRDVISQRLESKWTKRCGWAGAGDAEWGAGKYRVFDADAAVPAEGASAAGVGFTASATLGGGTLTLGDGGIFASEGTEATISAPVAGKIGAYGPGTVNIATAPGAVDSVAIGYGASLVIAAGSTTVAGGLSIQENGRLMIDVSALAANSHASISFANVVLPAGGDLYDYVSLTGNTAGHILTISDDGKTIHVNDPTVPTVAEWNATVSDDVTVAANWLCRNAEGTVLPNTTLPCFRTTNVTLNADCDLRAWGTPVFEDGVKIDLKGHVLKVADLSDDNYRNAVVTNSNAGTTAELRVEVADGTTATNSTVSILGDIRLVKWGLGTWTASKTHQTYSGGTTIKEGVLAGGVVDARNYHLGAQGSTITVSTNAANKGVFDLNGMYAQNSVCAAYRLVMDGGLVQNSGAAVSMTNGQFFDIRLTADSDFSHAADWGIFDGDTQYDVALDLGGHTLNVAIGNSKCFHIVNCTVKNGLVNITSGGWFQTGISGNAKYNNEIVATNADFRVGSAMRFYAPISVRNYEQVYGSNFNTGNAAFKVYGTFKPAAHNYFYGCTMQNGSTIDLSSRTDALPLVSSFTQGDNTLKFAAGTIHVKLGERTVTPDTCLISWSAKPDGIASTRFMNATGDRKRRFVKRDDGLYVVKGGFAVTVR